MSPEPTSMTLNEIHINKEQHGDLTAGLILLRHDLIHVAQAGLQQHLHVTLNLILPPLTSQMLEFQACGSIALFKLNLFFRRVSLQSLLWPQTCYPLALVSKWL